MNKTILKELGLTNNEVEIYLTLLKNRSISVNTIAEKAGLHRQAVYDALDRLLEKEFVSYVRKNNKKYFQGIHPEKILDYLKEKEERFKTLLPELINLTQLPEEDTAVEVYKGKSLVRTVYRDIIKEMKQCPGEILIFGVEESQFKKEDEIALKQHITRLKDLKCNEKILIKEGDTDILDSSIIEYRYLPVEFFNTTPTYVYRNKLTIIIWGKPNHVIMIENKKLADSYRKQFNLLWKRAKK